MRHINIEIKAFCDHQDEIRQILESKNADFKGLDHQIDTYFNVHYGRLKLREGNIENHLIHYKRDDKEGPKQSDVTLFKSQPGSMLKKILTSALGILVVVEKNREIFYIDNVKFHLDRVERLGTFIEIEAIGDSESTNREKLVEQCKFYLDLFKISYADLVNV